MTYYNFGPTDIINTNIVTNPVWTVTQNNNDITGSIFIEKQFQTSQLQFRLMQGFSERLGGLTVKYAYITASVSFQNTSNRGNNAGLFGSIKNLYNYHKLDSSNYNLYFTGSYANNLRVVSVPEVYYDNSILPSSFSAVDHDSLGGIRSLQDDGNGGIYNATNPNLLVGNIFYSEGLVTLKDPSLQDFGMASPDSFKWQVKFKGIHTIPVVIYKCRAPAGQLNASTNSTFYTQISGSTYNQVLTSSLSPYITAVGLYDSEYQLVAIGRMVQPVKKCADWDIGINLKLDW